MINILFNDEISPALQCIQPVCCGGAEGQDGYWLTEEKDGEAQPLSWLIVENHQQKLKSKETWHLSQA